jgi:hypothetical protein
VTALTLRTVFHLPLRQTEGFVHSPIGAKMLKRVGAPVERFTADGAHDTRAMYEALAAAGSPDLNIVIPPKRTAAADPRAMGAWRQRNEALERIGDVGRRQWRTESGAQDARVGANRHLKSPRAWRDLG